MSAGNKFQDLKIVVDTKDKNTPIYVQIKRQVLEYVQSKGYTQDDPMPDITSIANAAKVSLRTANQAMDSLATDGYCYRRKKHGSFYQEPIFGKRKLCVVLLSSLGIYDDEIELAYYNGLYSYGMECKIDVTSVHSTPADAFKFYHALDKVELCGMIVLGENSISSTITLAQQYPQKNFVFLTPRNSKIMGKLPENCYAILNDDYDGGYRLAEYYASLGIRSMAILSARLKENDLTYTRRTEGIVDAAKKYGIKFEPANDMLYCRPANKIYNQQQAAFLTTREYLAKKKNLPEIIFCTNDNVALGVKDALQSSGLQDRVIVTGYDGVFKNVALSRKFSTVCVPFGELGRKALEVLENPEKFENRIELKPELLIAPLHSTQND